MARVEKGGWVEQEKHTKRWRRAWKFELIERGNPEWQDLFGTLF